MSVSVRPATLDDLSGVEAVARETWLATYREYISEADIQDFLQANYSPERLRRSLDRLGAGFLVAVEGGQIVGYAMLSLDSDGHAQLWSIYILPGAQRRGTGQRLWDAQLQHARTLQAGKLVLWVLEGNSAARTFYERQGARHTDNSEFTVGGCVVSEVQYSLDLH